jgi:hypothetical protein
MIDSPDIRAVYIDESQGELSYAVRLTKAGLRCDPLPPGETVDEMLRQLRERLDEGYDVVLLDYRLDDRPEDRVITVNYRGGTVAAALKEQLPQVPLVLVTTADKFEASLEHNARVRRLFDLMVLKEELLTPLEQRRLIANDIKDLAMGYRYISQCVGMPLAQEADGWDVVANLMEATASERKHFVESHANLAPTGILEIAEWLLRDVLEFPGFLLDDRETAVRLGINENSFARTEVQEWLAPAQYSGPFSELRRRWWSGRVQERLREVAGPDSVDDSGRRTSAIAASIKVPELQADQCVWCGSGLISRACSICLQAVDPWHQLVGNLDQRPRWAEPAVICYRCIASGRAEKVRFGTGAEDIVEALKSGGLQPPSAR